MEGNGDSRKRQQEEEETEEQTGKGQVEIDDMIMAYTQPNKPDPESARKKLYEMLQKA